MAQIERIVLNVQTGKLSGAGTDGYVYLGVCGREFSINTTRDDFERESTRNYILGAGSNVTNSSFNDPRKQRLFVENVNGCLGDTQVGYAAKLACCEARGFVKRVSPFEDGGDDVRKRARHERLGIDPSLLPERLGKCV